MAPSPVLNIEPKGPDKNAEKCIESVSPKDNQNMPNTVDINATSKEKISVDQLSFADIEEDGLKSLLDEAYSYKSPKDRLGKSNLFQVLLNEVEENDSGRKKLSERSKSFADGRGNVSVSIGNGHDTANDKAFLNFLGGCEKDKKKKRNKRDGSSANNGSRRAKFSHSLKINHGPQSSSHIYNGSSSTNSNAHYNGSSRSLSRTHQPFTSRINSSKSAALLTSSSNIDIPMVTTSNKQPIMTPALVPSTQKTTELVMLDLREQNGKVVDDTAVICSKSNNAESENDAIEMKILETKNNDSVYNYTTHASLEIGGGVDGCAKQFNDYEKDANDTTAVIFPLQSSGLMNGNAERSPIQHSQKPVNGLTDEKEEIDNVISNNNNTENEEDKHSKKKNKKKQAPSSDNINDSSNRTSIYATSVDEPKTMTSLLQKSAQNSSTNNSAYKVPTESTLPYPWHYPYPNVILTLTGGNMCTKESLESRRLYDENTNTLNSSYPYLNSNSASMNRERLDSGSERKHKIRKPKKHNTTSVLSENIEGYCGDKSVEYLVEYIENTKPGSEGGVSSGPKSVKAKPPSSITRVGDKSNKNNAIGNNKASTDDDVRTKKPNKAKERLKKSTSLEDLRRSSSKSKQPNKKQSSVDDSHYDAKETMEIAEIQQHSNDTKALSDDSSHLYYDSIDHVDDDNYTETEFHLVTKKQRKKKRRSKSRTLDQKRIHHEVSQNFLPHNYTDKNDNGNFAYQSSKRSTRSSENRHRSRRKSVSSVVPSDKISDSDSIHSLPVSSTTPKCKIKKKSTSSGCTPQASYADIAKSPQCNSSTTLNGDSAKWHSSLKTFSNSPSAYSIQNTSGSTTASSFSSSASSSNTGDTPEHSDNSELVSSMAVSSPKGEDSNVASDESCDQLLLTNNNSTNEHTTATTTPDEGSSCVTNGVVECELTLKRKSKSKTRSTEDDTNNNTSMANKACCNAKTTVNGIDSKTPKDYHSNVNSSNTVCNNSNNVNHNSNNTNTTKVKKPRNKKNKNINNVDDNDTNDNHDVNCCKVEDTLKNGNDLSIEFTLKYVPSTTTKSSETQTDLEGVQVKNNACTRYHGNSNANGCNDVTVEETVVLKSNPSSGVATDGSHSQTSVDKLSHSLPTNNETGQTVLLLNDNSSNSAPSEITVGFDLNEQLLEDATTDASKETQDVQQEIIERSSKYNVTEVIQYVNKSWNEVCKSLTSSKVATTNKKVEYYVGK